MKSLFNRLGIKGQSRVAKRLRKSRRRLLLEGLEDRRLFALDFAFTYINDGSFGFNDPTLGTARRTALESTAEDFGKFFNDTATIAVDVLNINNAGTSTLASARPIVTTEGSNFAVRGIAGMIAQGAADPFPATADGELTVNWAKSFELADDFQAGEYDFTSVILHEMTHMMGFYTIINADASSDFTLGDNTVRRTTFEALISDQDGNALFDPNTALSGAFNAAVWANSTGGASPDNGLFFDGTNAKAANGGQRVGLFTPTTFTKGSSIAHIDEQNPALDGLLMNPTVLTGSLPRSFSAIEIGIMQDLGFDMVVPRAVTPPDDITLEGNTTGGFTGSNQTLADFLAGATANNLADNPVITSVTPELFALGENFVEFTATYDDNGTAFEFAIVTVVDTTPPEFSLPTSIDISANVSGGADVLNVDLLSILNANASDVVDDAPTFSASPSTFPLGTTEVTFTVTDSSGNSTSVSTMVSVTEVVDLTVTVADDSTDANDGLLSLREAIDEANQLSGFQVIAFDPALTAIGPIEILLSGGQLPIADGVTISGPGSDSVTINAQGASRVFVSSGATSNTNIDLTIRGLTLINGDSSSHTTGDTPAAMPVPGLFPPTRGGSIFFYSQGKLELDDVVITGSFSPDDGAAILHFGDGELVVNRSVISGNTSGDNGGAIYSRGVIFGSGESGGDVRISDSILSDNTARDKGGAVSLRNSNATVLRSTISGNQTTRVDGINGGAGFYTYRGDVRIVNSTLSGNQTAQNGGAINARSRYAQVDIVNSTISGNTAGLNGGGVYSFDGGVEIRSSTVTLNRALNSDSFSGIGGGLDVLRTGTSNINGPRLTILGSIVAGNLGLRTPDVSTPREITVGNPRHTVLGSLIGDNEDNGDKFLPESQSQNSLSGNIVGDSVGGSGVIDAKLGPLANNGGSTRTHALLVGSPAIEAGRLSDLPPDTFDLDADGDTSETIPVDQRGLPFARRADGVTDTTFTDAPDIGSYERQKLGVFPLVVTTLDDELDANPLSNPDGLSLREAIDLANGSLGDTDTNSITFAPGLTGTIRLTLGQMEITDDLELIGPAASLLTIDAGGGVDPNVPGDGFRIFHVDDDDASTTLDVAISGLTLTGGDVNFDSDSGRGGAVLNRENLTLRSSTISGNSSQGNGGGVWNAGTLTVFNSSILKNNGQYGGGIYSDSATTHVNSSTISNNQSIFGGGIDMINGNVTVNDSTLSGNIAQGRGGAIDNYYGNLSIENTTFTGNTAQIGGAINQKTGELSVRHSTISGNLAGNGGGAYATNVSGTALVTFSNTILTGNRLSSDDSPNDFAGNAVVQSSSSFNLFGTPVNGLADGTNDNVFDVDFKTVLVNDGTNPTLRSNGGPTRTIALLPTGPAIDSGDPAAQAEQSGVPAQDQRGGIYTRVFGGRIDIGAYESQTLDPSLFVVTTLADEFDFDNSDVSLREALESARGSVGGDTVTFASSLTSSGLATISLGLGELLVGDATTIAGPGADLLTVNGNQLNRLFRVNAGDQAEINGMTITGGKSDQGGGIYNQGTLVVDRVWLTSNEAVLDGGAIFNDGELTLTNSTLSDNAAVSGAGVSNGAFGEFEIASFTGNTSQTGRIARDGVPSSIENSKEFPGILTSEGDRFFESFSFVNPNPVASPVTVSFHGGLGSNPAGNSAFAAAYLDSFNPSDISENYLGDAGNSITTEDLFSFLAPANATIVLVISKVGTDSELPDFGFRVAGAIPVSVPESAIRFPQLTIVNSTVSGNTASGNGGGVYNLGNLAISNSTLANNAASDGSTLQNLGSVVMDNTIVSSSSGNDLRSQHGTISGRNNLVNDPASAGGLTHGVDGNILGTEAGSARGFLDVSLILGSLSDHGGGTPTHELVDASPAIDAGDGSVLPSGVTTDQRGVTRTIDLSGITNAVDGTDIGAVEMVGVSISNASANEDSGTLNLTVTLSDAIPVGSIATVQLDTSDVAGQAAAGSDYNPITQSITFIGGGPLTITANVTLTSDMTVESDETFAATLSNAVGAIITTLSAQGTIVNDDIAGFTLSKTTAIISEDGSTTDSFTVVLNAQPASDVVLDLALSANPDAAIDQSSLTFTNVNWNVPQIVIVTGLDDNLDDGDEQTTVTISINDVTSNDFFDTLADQVVTVTTTDDDTRGITVSATSGNTTEAGSAATFTVVLTSEPTADVVIGLSSSNTAEGTVTATPLTFTAANWNVAQTVTVTGVDDMVDDGDVAFTILTAAATGGDYAGLDAADVAVTNTDDDTRGITVSAISGNTTEAGSAATFTVVLTSQPTSDVVIGLSSSNTAEGTVTSTPLTFTTANWNVAQTVTVTGADDMVDDGDVAFTILTAAATGGDYAGLDAAEVAVTNTDDDTRGITVSAISGNTTEVGGTATFTVVLNSQPTAEVMIGLSSSNTAEGTVTSTLLTFTAANWNVAQTVTVTGVDDSVDDGDLAFTILTVAATGGDYAGLDAADVAVANTDDDTRGITVSAISGNMTEAGGMATFTVVLTSQPTADVMIGLSSSNTAEGTVTATPLTFTTANWNVAQTVTVTGVDDSVDDGDVSFTILTAVATGGDYAGVNAADVAVTNTDNDVAGFTLSKTTATVSESATTETFTVVLTSQPLSNVVIQVTSADTGEATADKAALTFTNANWNVAQTVAITGIDDAAVDGSQTTVITLGIDDANSDNTFDPLANQAVTVTTTDDDGPGFTVAQTAGSTSVSESGTTDTFTVVLTSQPVSNVVINVSSADTGEAIVDKATLTFTNANWNVPQTITVTGINDLVDDGDQSSLVTLSVDDASSDNAFDTLADQTVTVITPDNDAAGFTLSKTTATVSESATTESFTVVLTSQPLSNVVIQVTSADTGEATVDKATLTFTNANWNVPQTVAITGIDDAAVDGSQTTVITLGIDDANSDNTFDPLANQAVTVTTTDDDGPGFTVAQTAGSTTVSESGTTDTFTVVLTSQPVSNVVINVSSADTGEATVDKATLTFTNANWNTAQTVTVTGVSDSIVDGDQNSTITISIDQANSNNEFDVVADQTVTVTTMDTDVPLDFGDAPSQYPVTLQQNGARHVVGTLLLGATTDAESDGQPSTAADGDGSDEDGVVQTASQFKSNETATKSSFAITASAAGKLDAWIDFNQDGDWTDTGEQIFTSVDVVAGSNVLVYTIPAGAKSGNTFARFRLSTEGALAPTGAAADGEVEDYLQTIVDGDSTAGVTIEVIDGAIILTLDSTDNVIRSGGTELFRSLASLIGSLQVNGTATDDTITIDFASGFALPSGGINVAGAGGVNKLVLQGAGDIDLTSPKVAVTDVANIELASDAANKITIDAAAINRLSPATKTIKFTTGANDQFDVVNPEDWRMAAPIIVDGRFVLTSENQQAGGEQIQVDAARPYRNILQFGDVNNSGTVTASDALAVIFELNQRRFTDTSGNLVDPTQVTSPFTDYLDVNGDGKATAADALNVINILFQQSLGGGSGSGEELDSKQALSDFINVQRDKVKAETEESIPIPTGSRSPLPELSIQTGAMQQQFAPLKSQPRKPGEIRSNIVDELFSDEVFFESLKLLS